MKIQTVVSRGASGVLMLLSALVIAACRPPAAPPESAWRAPFLGVRLANTASGVVAKHVIANSPAAKAGLAGGDQIVAIDGAAVSDAHQVIARAVALGVGHALTLRVRHQDTERDVTATLASYPGLDQVLALDRAGRPAPDWGSAVAVQGPLLSLAELRGKVVVVDFWATWCAPCKQIVPQLSALQARYRDQGLVVIGFTDEAPEVAAAGAKALGIRYAIASDEGRKVARAFAVGDALPTMVLVDKKGLIREVRSMDHDVEEAIRALLAETYP